LENAGYFVLDAKGGEEALALMDEAKPDAVFLDLRMPGTTGWDVLEELAVRGNAVPVIVLSADASRGGVERCLELGARAHVRKPFRGDDLTSALRAVYS
jgi:two-component system, OmpR family, response regulator VicR